MRWRAWHRCSRPCSGTRRYDGYLEKFQNTRADSGCPPIFHGAHDKSHRLASGHHPPESASGTVGGADGTRPESMPTARQAPLSDPAAGAPLARRADRLCPFQLPAVSQPQPPIAGCSGTLHSSSPNGRYSWSAWAVAVDKRMRSWPRHSTWQAVGCTTRPSMR